MLPITGATGNIGRELVDLAISAGHAVRALTRNPAAAQLRSGVDVVAGSPTDHDSFRAAMEGVDAVLLVIMGDPRPAAQVLQLTTPSRAVLISSITSRTRPELSAADGFRETERSIRAAIPHATILRPGQFASNVLEWKQIIAEGTVTAPFADVAIPVIDPIDIAQVALLALLEDAHRGTTHELSGSGSLSSRQQAEVLTEVLERPIDIVDQDPGACWAASPWLPPEWADYVLAVKGSPTPDERRVLTTVEDLTTRPARTFRDWATRNSAAFA